MKEYMQESHIINFSHPTVALLAQTLANHCHTDVEIAKVCFIYVRDNIQHTGDHKNAIPTCSASEVLKHKTGWCYAKSHLLAALLRANNIPTALCYQRLFCHEYSKDSYCLHGLNAIYLENIGWYKVDARGNKDDVDAQFDPPHEKLAFKLVEGESNLDRLYSEPLDIVVNALKQDYDSMINNFPDICS